MSRTAIKRVPWVEPPQKLKLKAKSKALAISEPKHLIGFLTEALGGMPVNDLAQRYGLPVETVAAFANGIPRDLTGEVAFADPTRMFGNQSVPAYNPSELVSRKGLRVYDQMKVDDQVKAALTFKKLAVLSSGWEVAPPKEKPKDWEPARFIDYCLSNVAGSLNDCLMGVLTALDYGYCCAGSVIIHTLNGDLPIRELVGQKPWIFSWHQGRLRLAQAKKVWLTKRNASVVRVSYEWHAGGAAGRKQASIVCTPEHPFMLLDGTYRRAGELQPNDRLMPFSQYPKLIGAPGYRLPRMLVQTTRGYGKTRWEKRANWVLDELGQSVTDGFVAHHVDENTLNDLPDNLERREIGHHSGEHSRKWFAEATPEQLAERSRKARETLAKPEVFAKRSAAATANNKRTWQDPEVRARRSAGISKAKRERDAARHPQIENHCVLSVEPAGREDVYDMEVPGYHNFAAETVFVHNSVSEMVFAPIEDGEWKGKIGLAAIKARRPHYIDFRVDDYGNLRDDGIVQRNVNGMVALPRRKFIIFVHQQEFSNPYGRADLESAYRPWWIKENAYRWLAMLLERFGVPPIFALYNPRSLTTQQVGDLRRVIERLQAATAGALPRVSKDDLEMWSPELAGQTHTVFIPALQHLNEDIARSLLMPGMLGLTADKGIGSLARSKVHFDAFMMSLAQLQGRLSDTVMMDVVISLLMALNYNEEINPRFQFLEIDDTLRTELMAAWSNLVDKSVVRTQKEDEDHVRQLMGFPERASDNTIDTKPALPKYMQPLPAMPGGGGPPGGGGKFPPKGEPGAPNASGDLPRTLAGNEHAHALIQIVEQDHGREEPAPSPFVHASAGVSLGRAPNQYEKAVDFTQIARTLDEMQTKHVDAMVKALVEVRKKLVAYLRGNFNKNAVAIRSMKGLRGMPAVRKATVEMLDDGYARGRKAMKSELATAGAKVKAHADPHQPNYKPAHAITYLRTQADFTVSGIDSDLTKKVQQRLLNAISSGEYIEDTIRNIQSDFLPYVGDPNVIRDGEQIEPYRIETIVRTNLTDAFNRGRIIEAREAGDYLDAFEWSSIIDSVTTEVCQFLDGMLFAPDDQWLDVLAPPRHFNCRSILVPVVGQQLNEEDFITDGEAGKAQDLSGDGFTDKTKVRYLSYLPETKP